MALLVAEVGQNHCGDMNLAHALIAAAQANGADLVKFQLYDSKKLYGEYQQSELTKEQAFELFDFGKRHGIEVFFSVFDVERMKWCEEMGVGHYKIATLNKDIGVINSILDTKKPVFISMASTTPPIKYQSQIKYLYCIPKYPATLRRFRHVYFSEYDGYSDHCIGMDTAKIALARGAQIIEKHFAIDHDTGVDAKWSMTPAELRQLKTWEVAVHEVL